MMALLGLLFLDPDGLFAADPSEEALQIGIDRKKMEA